MAFSDADCSVRVAVVDLDGGRYARDLRLARVWDGLTWRWSDDWTLRSGVLERPGLRPVPEGSFLGQLEADAQGRVTAWSSEGRRVEVLRTVDGAFRGMSSGGVSVELTQEGGRASSGRTVTYQRTGQRLDGVRGATGRVSYEYDESRLSGISWDGAESLRVLAGGTSGLGGSWRCAVLGIRTRIQNDDLTWTVSHGDGTVEVEDPAGARMQSRWRDGLLLGWTDADGIKVGVGRDTSGRITDVRRGGDAVAALSWEGTTLTGLRDQQGGRWALAHGRDGVTRRAEPDGRSAERDVVAGFVRAVRRGNEMVGVTWDEGGRPKRLTVGAQGEVRLERNPAGELVKVIDAGGGVWVVERDGPGRPTALVAPSGARWEFRFSTLGRLESFTTAGLERYTVVRSGGALSQLVRGATRWTWSRDPGGRVSGLRDPEGQATTLSRDSSGRLVTVRDASGKSTRIGRDVLGRIRSVDDWRLVRDASGRISEVRAKTGALGGWSRDASGRVTGFGLGDVAFELTRDPAGRIHSVRAGESGGEKWRLERDSAGRVAGVVDARGDKTELLRDTAGMVTRLGDELGMISLGRDLRGRVSRVNAGKTWMVSRDVMGRVVRVEVDGLGSVGADYEPGGALKLVRLADGALVRRNESADAGELVGSDKDGASIGRTAWTLDRAGELVEVVGTAPTELERDPSGRLVRSVGPSGEWAWEAGQIRAPDGTTIRTDALGQPAAVALAAPGPWSLGLGEALYRWGTGGTLSGLDGSAGGAVAIHDALGRLVQLTLGERVVGLSRDGFGRLRKVGADVLVGWGGLLAVGDAVRVPLPAGTVARPGGAVFSDPRGYPTFVPWTGTLHPWPSGWVRAVDAAETGAGGRFVLPGGVLVDLLRATDPLSGASTAPDRWPWVPPALELAPSASAFATPDAATDAFWDAAPFDVVDAWTDPLAMLARVAMLPGGGPEAEEAPGLPWLPASLARSVPAPMSGYGTIVLDEDPVGAVVLRGAMGGEPPDDDALLRALLGPEITLGAEEIPGLTLPGPAFAAAPLADTPFGH